MTVRSLFKRPARVQLVCEGDGRTRQSMTKECDINVIMAQYLKTGSISHFARHSPRYDFADSVTFHDAMNVVMEGDRMFADLPSKLRARFKEPGDFLDFVQDEDNAEEMIELGLREPTPQETRQAERAAARTEVVPPVGAVIPSAPAESEAAAAAATASD